jgi:hypothetical protein
VARDRSRSPGQKGKGKGKAKVREIHRYSVYTGMMIFVKPGRFKKFTINVEANDTVDDVN